MKHDSLILKLADDLASDDHEFLTCYAHYLAERGHRDRTRITYLKVAAHWLRWRASLSEPPSFNRRGVEQFTDHHLPTCRCTDAGGKARKTVRMALNTLLVMQGYERIRSVRTKPTSPTIEQLITPFNDYLKTLCGLAAKTRNQHCKRARDFLWWRYGGQAINVDAIGAPDLIAFITMESRRQQPSSMRCVIASLRALLRFLRFRGHDTPTLEGNLAAPPRYRLAGLPHSLDDTSLDRFWASFDCSTAIGQRDYAMARCMADLGLRRAEVASLTLAAFDWRVPYVRLSSPKTRRETTLPLPAATAGAIVAYLRYGRPDTASRAVFVHHRAPLGQAVCATTVHDAIRRAFARAGLSFRGTHVLRRTLATRLLNHGAPLTEIADVLGHRSINTTCIYTKVDYASLQQVALPWPGGRHE